MSPEEAREIMHQGVYRSAVHIANRLPSVPNHHHVCVQNICDAIFGPEWHSYTFEEQCAKRTIIGQAYNRMLKDFLPVLQQFQHDTNETLRLDDATLASLFGRTSHTNTSATMTSTTMTSTAMTSTTKTSAMKTSDAFDQPTAEEPDEGEMADEEILKTKVAIERDQAARKNLDKYYEPCQQGRKDLMIRRAKEPEGNIKFFNHWAIPLNDDKKTKNCPKCGKSISLNGIKKHYQITHVKDPRWVIYCPASGCKFECWRGDATIMGHMAYHHEDLHREIFGQEDVQKQAEARQKARDKCNARRWAKVNQKAKGSASAVSEVGEHKTEQTEPPEDYLNREALDQDDMYDEDEDEDEGEDEDIDEEHMYDKVQHNENMPNQHTPKKHKPNSHVPTQYIRNQHIPVQNTPNPYMSDWYVQNHPLPNQAMPNQHMPNQYMHNQYIPNPYMLVPNVPHQHTANQHILSQNMGNSHVPIQYVSNQHVQNQHDPSQYMPNYCLPNLYMPEGYKSKDQMVDEDLLIGDGQLGDD